MCEIRVRYYLSVLNCWCLLLRLSTNQPPTYDDTRTLKRQLNSHFNVIVAWNKETAFVEQLQTEMCLMEVLWEHGESSVCPFIYDENQSPGQLILLK